ncbi:MAG TPA: type IX secretion system membrane protein PorP/SprF, partial [Bacteroidia bacterium]|nr:type IX secretion system membrane protein PorP/SprF [Bacteroidia bacterium]
MKKYICISLLASLHVMNCFSQEIRGFSTFNNIQLNPAYAGQDGKHVFNLAREVDTKYFDSELKGNGWPECYEFAYAADIPKLHSGAGLFASLFKIGIENYYKIGGLYDYNFKLGEKSNLRLG